MSENLTLRQRKAVSGLAFFGNASKAAKHAGISRETLYKWLRQPDFKAALQRAETEQLEALSRSMVNLAGESIETLRAVMAATDSTPGVKVRCAEIILANFLKVRELLDIDQRLAELEGQHEANHRGAN